MLRQQALAFLFSLAAGFAAGAIFDIYQVVRRLLGLKKVGTAIGDVLAWLVIAACAFFLLVVGNWAEVRLYVFVSLAVGLAVHRKLCSKWVQTAVLNIFLALRWTIRTIIRAIVFPWYVLRKLLTYPVAAAKWILLLLLRIVEYAFSFPHLAIQNVIKGRRQPPPQL